MSDHAALLAAICANPDEDTPRLAFADWLEEHADTFPTPAAVRLRARFVRDDVTLSARDEYDPERLRWELVEKSRREAEPWNAVFPAELLAPERGGSAFRRGFPWAVRLTPAQFLAGAARVLPHVPEGTLVFANPDRAWAELTRSPHLRRLTGLHVRQAALDPAAVRALAASPHADRLEWLSAGHDGVTRAALADLLWSPLMGRLRKLDLDGRPWVGGAFAFVVGQMTGARPLRELGLADAGLTGAHVERLLSSTAVANVERLVLARNRIGAAGHEAIARLPLDHLRKLDLSGTAPGAEGVRVLATSLTLSRLERLAYQHNHVNGAQMTELAGCHEVSNLRVLHLGNNAIGNAGAAAIARSPYFGRLLYLNLSYCMVGDEGILALLESPLADTLALLDLSGSPASADTLERLKARMGDRVRV